MRNNFNAWQQHLKEVEKTLPFKLLFCSATETPDALGNLPDTGILFALVLHTVDDSIYLVESTPGMSEIDQDKTLLNPAFIKFLKSGFLGEFIKDAILPVCTRPGFEAIPALKKDVMPVAIGSPHLPTKIIQNITMKQFYNYCKGRLDLETLWYSLHYEQVFTTFVREMHKGLQEIYGINEVGGAGSRRLAREKIIALLTKCDDADSSNAR